MGGTGRSSFGGSAAPVDSKLTQEAVQAALQVCRALSIQMS